METSKNSEWTNVRETISRRELELEPKLRLIWDKLRQEADETPDKEVRLELTVTPDPPTDG
jgi:hypothetical protein